MADPPQADLMQLVEGRSQWLLRCAYLLTRQQEAALDLVQDTLAQAWSKRDAVARADDVERYVMRIMLNLFRSQKRRRSLRLVDLGHHEQVPALPDFSGRVDDIEHLRWAMASLSERQRAVIVLRYWADYDDEQIAEVLQCRRATVRSIAARSIHKLKSQMENA